MRKQKAVLASLVLLSNLGIIAGAVAFSWSPLTVVALFVADASLGAVRISIERLFAAKPRGDAQVPAYPILPLTPFFQKEIYESLLDKRGTIQLADRMPAIYPRNIPFALHCWVFIAALAFLLGVTWFAIGPATGTIDVTLGLVLVLIVARHVSIVATWAASGRYKYASGPTVRPNRDLLFSFGVVFLAVVFLAPQPADGTAAVAAIVPLVPKLLFDLRDAGLGPGPLAFDPSSDAAEQSVSSPPDSPRHTFRTLERAVRSTAVSWGVVHVFATPGVAIIAAFGFLAFLYESILIAIGGVVLAVLLAMVADYVATWLAHNNVEYRVYDDTLVAYDRYLEEPQWAVPVEDIRTIETDEGALTLRLLPFTTAPVEIQRSTGEDFRLEHLENPERFVQTVRGTMLDQSATP